MFALFYNLYLAMFQGNWVNYPIGQINGIVQPILNKVVKVLTNIFNSTTEPITDINLSSTELIQLASLVLALITSIGIVVMAVKGVKKAFGIFFMGIRR